MPNNAALTIVGDVTAGEARRMVQDYFDAIPRGEPVPELPLFPAIPRTSGEHRADLDDPLAQLPLIWVAYSVPPVRHADSHALALLSTIFSAGESSRLQRRLVQKEGAALDVVAYLRTRWGPGLLMFGAIPNLGIDVARMEELMAAEITRLREEGVTDRELAKAKNQQCSAQVAARLQVQSKGELLQNTHLRYRDPFRVNGETDLFEAVTLADIRRVARVYLTPGNRTVVIAHPVEAAGP